MSQELRNEMFEQPKVETPNIIPDDFHDEIESRDNNPQVPVNAQLTVNRRAYARQYYNALRHGVVRRKVVKVTKDCNGGYKCPAMGCGYVAKSWHRARTHCKTHDDEELYQCKLCKAKFTQRNNWVAADFMFQCSHCDAAFAHYDCLKKHNTVKHGTDYSRGEN